MLVLVYLLATAVVQLQSFTLKRKVLGDSCRISVNQHLPSIAPLVLNVTRGFLYPNEGDTIVLEPGTPFFLYCESSFSDRKIQEHGIQVTCNKGDTVTYAGNTYQFSRLGCIKHPDSTVHRTVGSCAGQHSLIDIGFEYTRSVGVELDGSNDDSFDEGTEKDISKGTDEGIDKGNEGQDVDWKEEGEDEETNAMEEKETVVIEQETEVESVAVGTGDTEESKDEAKISRPEFAEKGSDQKSSLSENASQTDVKVLYSEHNNIPSKTEKNSNTQKLASLKFRRKFLPRQPKGATEFVKLIQVCYDFTRHTTLYSVHSLDERIRGHQSGVKRTPFKTDIFKEENIDVNYLYTHKGQTERLTKLLGSEDLAKKYIQNDDHFLSRGHYSPKADFIFGAEQIATFYFINVAPQWQTFNGGNWVHLEEAVRDLTIKEHGKIQVYTGTSGVITLKDINDNDVQIYLGEKDGRQIVPVPKYYWKVIYNPETKDGLALIGLNNPYHEVSEDDVLCEDVCHAYSWVDWDLKNQQKGYMFCCILAEFQKKLIDLGLELP